MVDATTLADIVNALPAGSDGTLLEGVGHFPFLESPDEVKRNSQSSSSWRPDGPHDIRSPLIAGVGRPRVPPLSVPADLKSGRSSTGRLVVA